MGDISQTEIDVFLKAVGRYFEQITTEAASVQGAYLGERGQLPPTYDFTGMIAVSGRYAGCIYFSAPRQMIRHLLVAMHEPNQSDENLIDAVGEIANTLAGNARAHFGEHMEISVPISLAGTPERIKSAVRARPYVIKVNWKQYEAALIVDIERRG
ncbi:MAG TPA: chemotaxis protein CheX [Rhodocyclaceae bacterium]|jgi:chemotaxis protein CheX|nr:chemotaxis protein CheX [Rhodocyclaceae bacterium]